MTRLRIIGLVTGFALATAFGAGQANAEELTGTLKKIKETGAITIGFRDSSIPFSYLDDNQNTTSSTPSRKSSSSTSSRSSSIR